MEALIPVLTVAGRFVLASALLMILYRMVWRKNSTYAARRVFLSSIPAVSWLIALVQVVVYRPAPIVERISSVNPRVTTEIPPEPSLDMLYILLYLLIALACSFPIFRTLYKLKEFGRGAVCRTESDGISILTSEKIKTPFSFHRTIYLPNGLTAMQHRLIVKHEKSHIRHKHYMEIWLADLLTRLFWFNPILWWMNYELRNVHEFEADYDVLNNGENVHVYQTTLLEGIVPDDMISLGVRFNQSIIRQRFVEMIQSTNSTMSIGRKIASTVWIVLTVALMCGTVGEAQRIYVVDKSEEKRPNGLQSPEEMQKTISDLKDAHRQFMDSRKGE